MYRMYNVVCVCCDVWYVFMIKWYITFLGRTFLKSFQEVKVAFYAFFSFASLGFGLFFTLHYIVYSAFLGCWLGLAVGACTATICCLLLVDKSWLPPHIHIKVCGIYIIRYHINTESRCERKQKEENDSTIMHV